MTDAVSHPTTRDEDWRYADAGFLEEASTEALTQWAEWSVASGETKSEFVTLLSGPEARGNVQRIRAQVGKDARLEVFAVLAGGHYQRYELEVTLAEGAHFEFGGVTLGGGDTVQEFVTRTIHAEPNATSNQTVRAVHWGHATGNFLGRIEVVRDAQKTDAAQNFRAILLEKGATANTKPELEIFADDVQCAHGAAIGQLDQAAAYYMASRGIAPDVARNLLIRAFIADAFAEISDVEIQEQMLACALEQLETQTA